MFSTLRYDCHIFIWGFNFTAKWQYSQIVFFVSSFLCWNWTETYTVNVTSTLPANIRCKSVSVAKRLKPYFYSVAALLAMQSAVLATAIPSVCVSVRPSVTRWYLVKKNEDRITRLSPWGSKNTLAIWYQKWLGATPLPPKMCAQSGPPPLKNADFD